MPSTFPIAFSILAPEALARLLQDEYGLDAGAGCRLWQSGSNTTYAVDASPRRMLRVYHAGRRSSAQVQYELEFIRHLARRGVPVAQPIPTRSGKLFLEILAPEGTRQVALFQHAGGQPANTDENVSYQLGWVAAQIHNAASDFRSTGERWAINLELLIEQPMAELGRRLSHMPDLSDKLADLCATVRLRLDRLVPDLEHGVCHGDLFRGNCQVTADGRVVVFDFDECGTGPLAYDLAVFWHSVRREGRPDDMWRLFLRGYCELRELRRLDHQTIPLLAAARQIWFMGQLAGKAADLLGHKGLDDQFFATQTGVLEGWIRSCPAKS